MSLVPSLLQAIVRVDGDALVMHAGDKPYVVAPTGQVDLASRGLSLEAVEGIVAQLLSADTRNALDEFGAVQYELPSSVEFPNERFTVVAARGGDDLWVEVRRHRVTDDDLVPDDLFAPAPVHTPDDDHVPAELLSSAPNATELTPESLAEEPITIEAVSPVVDDDLDLPHAAQLFPQGAGPVEVEAAEMRPVPQAISEPEPVAIMREPEPVAIVSEPEPVAIVSEPEPVAMVSEPEPVAIVSEPEPVAIVSAPEPVAMMPEPEPIAMMPEPEPVAMMPEPEPVAIMPEPEPVAMMPEPEPVSIMPEPEPVAMMPEPEPVAIMPEPEWVAMELEPVATLSEPVATMPEPVATMPEPVATTPEPVTTMPEPVLTMPEPVTTTPEPVMTTPEPVATTPEPVTTTSEPVAAILEPEPVAIMSEPEPVAEVPAPVSVAPPPPPVASEPLEPAVAPAAAIVEPAAPIVEPAAAIVPLAAATVEPAARHEPRRPQPKPAPVMVPPPPASEPAVVLPMSRNPIRAEQPAATINDPTMDGLQRLLRISAARGASTLYLSSDARPSVRVDGELYGLDSEPVLTARDIESLLLTLMPERSHEALRTGAPSEWMCDIEDVGRVRCTTFRDHVGPGGVFRLMPTRTISAEQLGLPRSAQALAMEPEGLVLIVGPRSSGKRTLMSAFVDLINRSRRDHVITIEREINIVHPRVSSFISQREVRGSDDDLLAASRAALREDPDVLVIEDLRTGPLMNVALEAAASGRLVVGGFSAHTATAAIDRIIDLYAPDQRHQVQLSIADTLRGVIGQVLLRKIGGGRIAAREVLLNTPAVSGVIAEGKTSQLPMAIEGGRRHGMVPLSDTLVALVQGGAVNAREAYRHASDRAGLVAALKRQGVDTSELASLVG